MAKKGAQNAIHRKEKEEDAFRKVKAEEVERQKPVHVKGDWDRQERKDAKSQRYPASRDKATVHEGRENGRDRGGRPSNGPQERRQPPAASPSNSSFKGKSILNTYNAGRTRDARNKPR